MKDDEYKFAWVPLTTHTLIDNSWVVTGQSWLKWVRVVRTIWGDVIYERKP